MAAVTFESLADHVGERKRIWRLSALSMHRLANQLLALLLIVLLSPLMLAVALWIARVDGGPVLFGHYRVGLRGRLFRCLKFRTMYRDSEAMLATLLANDPQARAQWARDQ